MSALREAPARFGIAFGILLIVAGMLAGHAVSTFSESRQLGIAVVGLTMIVSDVAYRLAFAPGHWGQKLWIPSAGPHLKVPVWVVGTLLLVGSFGLSSNPN
jgi:hypothetical protein